MIFVISKNTPSLENYVEVIDYKGTDDNAEDTFKNIKSNKKITKKKIRQQDLLVNVANWNFIKQNNEYIEFYSFYKRNSMDMSLYRAQLKTGDDFSFDGGVIIDTGHIAKNIAENEYELFDYKNNNWGFFSVSKSNLYYSVTSPIKFPEGSQGIETFKKKYKIIWRTMFTNNFQFTDRNILLVNNQSLLVSSNSEDELLYLFALLNSSINKLVLEKNLKQENEKNYLIPLRAVKSYIRIPSLVGNNTYIKKEVVDFCKKLLNLEKPILADFVDFSKTMVQKFDKVSVEASKLILEKDRETIKLPIKKDFTLVKKVIEAKYGQDGLGLENKTIMLSELMSLPAIDFETQKEIKDLIDNLVFCLYFNIDVPKEKIFDTDFIKSLCMRNKFYKQVSSSQD